MKRIVLSNHISWQKVPNNEFAFVYNIKTHKYYKFENTELYIWEIIVNSNGVTLDDILIDVVNYFEVELNEIKEDIVLFIDSLLNIGVVEYVE